MLGLLTEIATLETEETLLRRNGITVGDSPYELTARATTTGNFLYEAPPEVMELMTGISREKLLWMMVVLQAIAEQDPQFVVVQVKARGQERAQRKREKLAAEAREFLQSPEFERACHRAGISPNFARSISPEKAAYAMTRLQRDESNNAVQAEDEDLLDSSEAFDKEPESLSLLSMAEGQLGV